MRRLSLVFGHSIFSVSTVLTTFMSGLALGSYLGGVWSDRERKKGRPAGSLIGTYGKLELFIGLWAVLSLPLLDAVEAGYLALARSGQHGAPLTAFLFVASFLVLLPPTTAMGATLPVFTQVLVGRKEETGSLLSRIYGLNTLGACCGAAFGGMAALPTLGLKATVLVTAALNVAIALLARSLAGSLPNFFASLPQNEAVEPEPAHSLARPAGLGWVPLVFGLSGFTGMVYQLGWTRALILSIGSSTYSFTIVLTSFLISLALGSFLYRRLYVRRSPSLEDLARLQLLIAAASLLTTAFMAKLPLLKIATQPYVAGSFARVAGLDFLTVFALLLLPTLGLGLTFPLVTHLYTSSLEQLGKRLGEAYAANTTGSILGSFTGGFVLLPLLGLQAMLKGAAVLNLLGALLLLWQTRALLQPAKRKIEALLALFAVLMIALAPAWDLGLLSSGVGIGYQALQIRPDPVYYRDGVSSTVTVGLSDGLTPYIAVNGKIDASLAPADRNTQLLLGLVPGVLHPDPRKVAVIGFGSGQTAVGLLSLPGIEEVRCAELEPAVLEAKKYFAPFSEGAFDDPRLKLVEDDGRSFILGSPHPYDVIVSEPSNPWIAGIGNLYTRDFYQGCRERLAPGGLMGQWFHLYAMSPNEIDLVFRTFFSVFPEGALYRTGPGDILLIGSDTAPQMNPERLKTLFGGDSRAAAWVASMELVDPMMFFATYLASREEVVAYLDSHAPGFAGGPVNTDNLPLLEFQAPMNLYARTGVGLEQFTSLLPPAQQSSVHLQQAAVLGRTILKMRFDHASALDKLRQADPQGRAWYPQLVSALLEEQRVDFERLLKGCRPEDRAWLERLAVVWKIRTQDYDGLDAAIARALKTTSGAPSYWLLRYAAMDARGRGDLTAARQFYAQAQALTSSDVPFLEAARLTDDPAQWDEALLQEVLRRNPDSGAGHQALALLYSRQGKLDLAIQHAEESYRLFSGDPVNVELLTNLYREKGDRTRGLFYRERLAELKQAR